MLSRAQVGRGVPDLHAVVYPLAVVPAAGLLGEGTQGWRRSRVMRASDVARPARPAATPFRVRGRVRVRVTSSQVELTAALARVRACAYCTSHATCRRPRRSSAM